MFYTDEEVIKQLKNLSGKARFMEHYSNADLYESAAKKIEILTEVNEELTEALRDCRVEVERLEDIIDRARKLSTAEMNK